MWPRLCTCVCVPCPAPFRLAILQHYYIIHGEKKHKCRRCSKGFGLARACAKHEQECGQIFRCSCNHKPFTNKAARNAHAKRKKHQIPTDAPVKAVLKTASTLTTDNYRHQQQQRHQHQHYQPQQQQQQQHHHHTHHSPIAERRSRALELRIVGAGPAVGPTYGSAHGPAHSPAHGPADGAQNQRQLTQPPARVDQRPECKTEASSSVPFGSLRITAQPTVALQHHNVLHHPAPSTALTYPTSSAAAETKVGLPLPTHAPVSGTAEAFSQATQAQAQVHVHSYRQQQPHQADTSSSAPYCHAASVAANMHNAEVQTQLLGFEFESATTLIGLLANDGAGSRARPVVPMASATTQTPDELFEEMLDDVEMKDWFNWELDHDNHGTHAGKSSEAKADVGMVQVGLQASTNASTEARVASTSTSTGTGVGTDMGTVMAMPGGCGGESDLNLAPPEPSITCTESHSAQTDPLEWSFSWSTLSTQPAGTQTIDFPSRSLSRNA